VEQYRYFGKTITNQNCIHEQTKNRLKSGNACYHSGQNLLSSSLLSKNINIKECLLSVALPPNAGHGLLIFEVSRSHSDNRTR